MAAAQRHRTRPYRVYSRPAVTPAAGAAVIQKSCLLVATPVMALHRDAACAAPAVEELTCATTVAARERYCLGLAATAGVPSGGHADGGSRIGMLGLAERELDYLVVPRLSGGADRTWSGIVAQ